MSLYRVRFPRGINDVCSKLTRPLFFSCTPVGHIEYPNMIMKGCHCSVIWANDGRVAAGYYHAIEGGFSRLLCPPRHETYDSRLEYYTLMKHSTGAGHLIFTGSHERKMRTIPPTYKSVLFEDVDFWEGKYLYSRKQISYSIHHCFENLSTLWTIVHATFWYDSAPSIKNAIVL